jgi:CRP/FNR family transcriptional regulator, cyclic AMP receptor protein
MRSILEHCAAVDAPVRQVEAGTALLVEGETSGRLYVLKEGAIEVTRGDIVVAVVNAPGAVFGEMSALLAKPHSATVRTTSAATVYAFDNSAAFLRSHPEIAYCVARLLAQRLHAATTYLVDLKLQFDGHANHFGMVDEVLESLLHHQDDVSPGSDRQPDPPK